MLHISMCSWTRTRIREKLLSRTSMQRVSTEYAMRSIFCGTGNIKSIDNFPSLVDIQTKGLPRRLGVCPITKINTFQVCRSFTDLRYAIDHDSTLAAAGLAFFKLHWFSVRHVRRIRHHVRCFPKSVPCSTCIRGFPHVLTNPTSNDLYPIFIGNWGNMFFGVL